MSASPAAKPSNRSGGIPANNCRYDGGIVAATEFVAADISTRDYFHPSLAGQVKLASITWPKTQWVS